MWQYRKTKQIILWVCLSICLILVGFATVQQASAILEGKLQLSLNGDSVVLLAPGQRFEDPGAEALLVDGEDRQEIPVQISGTVDSSKLGTYMIKYQAEYKNQMLTAYRAVHIADTEAPQIQLTEDENHVTMPGTPYVEEGFVATDNVDGDITHLVRRSERNGAVTYAVRDRSGNETVVMRRIRYKDTTAPVVTIAGNLVVAVPVGQNYQEAGYTATDNLEGNITGFVKVSGNVDTQTPGTYILKYEVKDSFGNLGMAERIVCVYGEGDVVPNGKVIYLTFDDGPGPHTDRLLDVLAQHNVKATFFLVNNGLVGKADRMVKEGHTVAIHTMTHKYSQIYQNEDTYLSDLYGMQAVIESRTGVKTTIARFPGGSSNTVSKNYNKGLMTRLVEKLPKLGFRMFDWNVDSRDAGGTKTTEGVLANVIAGVQKRDVSVVLQHDIYGYSVDAVEQIILWGKENGYVFAPLSMGSPECLHTPNN